MSAHAARREPGEDVWHCRCGHTHPYTSALAMIDEFKAHVADAESRDLPESYDSATS